MDLIVACQCARGRLRERMHRGDECKPSVGVRGFPIEGKTEGLLIAAQPGFPLALGKAWTNSTRPRRHKPPAGFGRQA